MIEFREFTDMKNLLGVFRPDSTRLGIYDKDKKTFSGMSIVDLEQILTKMKALQDTACNMQGEKV